MDTKFEVSSQDSHADTLRGAYLDPNIRMNLADQLEVVTGFWADLDQEVPKLTDAQEQELQAVLETNPIRRLMPVLLTESPIDRPVIFEGAKKFPNSTLNPEAKALWTPDQDWAYSQLLSEPEAVLGNGHSKQAMGYRTPAGVITTRKAYIESLQQAGQTVEGENGSIWTFVVTDVSVASPRVDDLAGNLHAASSPLESPEMLIATQFMHQANGTPNPDLAVDLANEAIYEVKERGRGSNRRLEFLSVMNLVTVRWDPNNQQVRSNYGDPKHQADYFGLRGAINGISES